MTASFAFILLQIKICDCILELKEALTSGTKYDYVINDLTEFSVDKDKYGEWRRNINKIHVYGSTYSFNKHYL